MLWGSSLRFSQFVNRRLVKCCNWPIVVDNDSMELYTNKSNIHNEERLVTIWGNSLRFPHLPIVVWSNAVIDQSLLVMIQLTYREISPTLIMKRGLQCFEEPPYNFHILLTVVRSNVALDQLLLVMIQWNYSYICPILIMKKGL